MSGISDWVFVGDPVSRSSSNDSFKEQSGGKSSAKKSKSARKRERQKANKQKLLAGEICSSEVPFTPSDLAKCVADSAQEESPAGIVCTDGFYDTETGFVARKLDVEQGEVVEVPTAPHEGGEGQQEGEEKGGAEGQNEESGGEGRRPQSLLEGWVSSVAEAVRSSTANTTTTAKRPVSFGGVSNSGQLLGKIDDNDSAQPLSHGYRLPPSSSPNISAAAVQKEPPPPRSPAPPASNRASFPMFSHHPGKEKIWKELPASPASPAIRQRQPAPAIPPKKESPPTMSHITPVSPLQGTNWMAFPGHNGAQPRELLPFQQEYAEAAAAVEFFLAEHWQEEEEQQQQVCACKDEADLQRDLITTA